MQEYEIGVTIFKKDIMNLKENHEKFLYELKIATNKLKDQHMKQRQDLRQKTDTILSELYEKNIDLEEKLRIEQEKVTEELKKIEKGMKLYINPEEQKLELDNEKYKGITQLNQEIKKYTKEQKTYETNQKLS